MSDLTPDIKPPQTVAGLVRAIEQVVNACVGPPRAYFDIHTDPPVRIVYKTWKVAAIGGDELEALLCMAFWANFVVAFTPEMINDRSHTLFWRTLPVLTAFTNEKGQDCIGIRARLACPGVEFPIGMQKNEGERPSFIN